MLQTSLRASSYFWMMVICVVFITGCGPTETVETNLSDNPGGGLLAAEPSDNDDDGHSNEADPGNAASALLNANLDETAKPTRPATPQSAAQETNQLSIPESDITAKDLSLMIPEALAASGSTASKKGRHGQAALYYAELLRRLPGNTRVMMHLADNHFMACQIDEAIASYDLIIEADPKQEPYLWQRGLALYYAKRYQEGVEQFEKHWVVNRNDVENSVWHMLCKTQADGLDAAREKLIDIKGDKRVPMAEVLKLYAGKMTADEVRKVAETPAQNDFQSKIQRYYGNLYIGLYQEMIGEKEASLESIKRAKGEAVLEKDILMSQIAAIHLKMREMDIETENEQN